MWLRWLWTVNCSQRGFKCYLWLCLFTLMQLGGLSLLSQWPYTGARQVTDEDGGESHITDHRSHPGPGDTVPICHKNNKVKWYCTLQIMSESGKESHSPEVALILLGGSQLGPFVRPGHPQMRQHHLQKKDILPMKGWSIGPSIKDGQLVPQWKDGQLVPQ